MTETVTVEAKALKTVLDALVGPPHLIRELQALYGSKLEMLSSQSPIKALIDQYHDQVNKG